MIIVLCIMGWALAIVSIVCEFYLLSENCKLEDDKEMAELMARQNEALVEFYKDKSQRLAKEIYGLSDNRCNECGRFLPKNQDGLCEVCAWAKGGDI